MINEVKKYYDLSGNITSCEPFGQGHINDTYLVILDDGKKYILQRINTRVFKNPDELMQNIEGVTNFLRKKIIDNGGNPDRESLTIIKTIDNKTYFADSNSDCWRIYTFIDDAVTYQIAESPLHLYESGRAFGMFQKNLADYPAHTLFEPIANFHNTKVRFETFLKAVDEDVKSRKNDALNEIEFAMKRAGETGILVDMLANSELPLRVTHNDTKFNNVIIDKNTGKAICVVDLDTVMPGLALYDYGDSIRSSTNPADEDEKDISKVFMDNDFFESFTKGYLEVAKEFLQPNEIKMLAFSAKLMTLECGIRFLTDHLQGDVYFKTHRENHNLDRCRTQFKLVADMEEKMQYMHDFINSNL